ncbi:hypothetical protein HWV62_37251 [Athelia sp. TMB]|nr:hypothetical protein HWV62_37251 [Athelia sp. TMB]
MSTQVAPVPIVTVNPSAETPKKVLEVVTEDYKDQYNLVHAGNYKGIEGLKAYLLSLEPAPQLLFSSNHWTVEQQGEIQVITKEAVPGIKIASIPHNLDAQGVVNFVKAQLVEQGIPRRT